MYYAHIYNAYIYNIIIIIEEKVVLRYPSYISYNNFVNNQYLSLKLNNYI